MTRTRHHRNTSLLGRVLGVPRGPRLALTTVVATTQSSAVAAASGTGTGYLSTNGNQIVDSTGATVRLTGINWFGMETDNKTFHGLWASVTWKSTDRPHGPARLQHDPGAVRRRRAQAGRRRDERQHQHQPGPGRAVPAADPGQGRRLRRHASGMRVILDRHRPTRGRPDGALVHRRRCPRRAGSPTGRCWPAVRGQHDGDRRRPVQRAARRGHRTRTAPAPAGAAATPPATGGWPPSGSATRCSPPTRTG